jgi:outer membrane protein TolC
MLRRSTSVIVGAWAGLLAASASASAAEGADSAAPLRLEDAVQMALARNERARISDFQVVVSEAGVEKALAAFLPIASVVAEDAQHPDFDHPANVGNASLTVSQPILNASAFPLYGQAKRLADAQHAQNVDDKRLLAFSAANAFFAVLNADDLLKAAERQLDMAKENQSYTQARAEAGLTSTNDVTRARIDLASAQRQVESDKGNLESAHVQLELTIFAQVLGPLAPPLDTMHAASASVGAAETFVRFAMEHRPDVLASRESALAAHDFASEPLLRLVPTLAVQGQATATTNAPAATRRWNDETLTATLGWTLYDAGVRYADKRSRDAQAAIADLTLQALGRTVDAQVRSAIALLVSAQAALHVAEDAMNAARQSADETEVLYKQGLAKAIELVDANDTRFTAEVNYATAEYNVAQTYLGLRQAVGLEPLGADWK